MDSDLAELPDEERDTNHHQEDEQGIFIKSEHILTQDFAKNYHALSQRSGNQISVRVRSLVTDFTTKLSHNRRKQQPHRRQIQQVGDTIDKGLPITPFEQQPHAKPCRYKELIHKKVVLR